MGNSVGKHTRSKSDIRYGYHPIDISQLNDTDSDGLKIDNLAIWIKKLKVGDFIDYYHNDKEWIIAEVMEIDIIRNRLILNDNITAKTSDQFATIHTHTLKYRSFSPKQLPHFIATYTKPLYYYSSFKFKDYIIIPDQSRLHLYDIQENKWYKISNPSDIKFGEFKVVVSGGKIYFYERFKHFGIYNFEETLKTSNNNNNYETLFNFKNIDDNIYNDIIYGSSLWMKVTNENIVHLFGYSYGIKRKNNHFIYNRDINKFINLNDIDPDSLMNYECMLYIPFKKQFIVFGSAADNEMDSIWSIDANNWITNKPKHDNKWINKLKRGDVIKVYNEKRFEWENREIILIDDKQIVVSFCNDCIKIKPSSMNSEYIDKTSDRIYPFEWKCKRYNNGNTKLPVIKSNKLIRFVAVLAFEFIVVLFYIDHPQDDGYKYGDIWCLNLLYNKWYKSIKKHPLINEQKQAGNITAMKTHDNDVHFYGYNPYQWAQTKIHFKYSLYDVIPKEMYKSFESVLSAYLQCITRNYQIMIPYDIKGLIQKYWICNLLHARLHLKTSDIV